MARKQTPDPPPPSSPAWMASYSDLMSLLLCFFVMLFSMSEINSDQWRSLAEGMSSNNIVSIAGSSSPSGDMSGLNSGGGILQLPDSGKGLQTTQATGNELNKEDFDEGLTEEDLQDLQSKREMQSLTSEFKTYFADSNFAETIQVQYDPETNTISINFLDSILFESASAVINTQASPLLDEVIETFRQYSDYEIKIEGHTDNVPMSRTREFADNWELSSARALSVLRYFQNQHNYDPTKLSFEGLGEYKPIASNDTAEGRAMNRRVEIKVQKIQETGTANIDDGWGASNSPVEDAAEENPSTD